MKALIVEDIKSTSDLIKGRIQKLEPSLNEIDQAYNLDEAYLQILENEYDLLFLDIQLPNGTTFDLLRKLSTKEQIKFEIIFITGQKESEFIMNAIKFSAIDFLHKPLDDEELSVALNKAIKKIDLLKYNQQIDLLLDIVSSQEHKLNSRIAINLNKGIIKFFDVNEICYLEADGVITRIHLVSGKEYSATKNLGYYKSFMVSQFNYRSISQSLIVNMDHLEDYNHSELKVRMKNGLVLKASRRGGKEFKQALEDSVNDGVGIRALLKKLFNK